jgi:Fe-S cluster biogenesis protein NfuA
MMPVTGIVQGTVEVAALQARIDQVNAVMRSHGGRLELIGVDLHGVVELRFAGMCQGCPFRPVTMHATVVPALSEVQGVTEVRADGTRVSEFAAERLRAAFGGAMPHLPSVSSAAQ